ncbi:MAG: diguanylate cyclase [Actinobacteria bacterium]|nr:diguanylate cyclase [Actinomycetota bacterium]MBV9663047.1 diguanylate cyclase [Actinomycetota bacterium]MBV9933405.1 diguanylate cyclase [Actinomycetota bacterium]
MDRRRLPGLAIGVTGLAFGLAAAAQSSRGLAVVAAVCALAAGASSMIADRREAAIHQAVAVTPPTLTGPPTLDMPAAPILDPETGLPDDRYFGVSLEERVAAARRHLWPATVLLLELEPVDDEGMHAGVVEFASLLRQTLRQSDVACRLDATTFGVILEDTAETGGVWSAERLQLVLTKRVSGVKRMAAGVASYPTHGLAADTILGRARDALTRARETSAGHGLGQVEVAVSDQS